MPLHHNKRRHINYYQKYTFVSIKCIFSESSFTCTHLALQKVQVIKQNHFTGTYIIYSYHYYYYYYYHY